jgi:3-isopropylmalate/(R)-2-methylmalate dehydratase small subunit
MNPFTKLKSRAVPLPMENIDTDQIIPARFLKATDRVGFGENLFRDWRYSEGDAINEHFILNNPKYNGSILVCGKNFGCGSSREHAAWALYDYGFKVVISSFFADIFKTNALNNGILPIELPEKDVHFVFQTIERDLSTEFEVDLDRQEFSIPALNFKIGFEIDPYKKLCLINGQNDIDYLLSILPEIEEFEKTHLIY